jgi:hypothetical protein
MLRQPRTRTLRTAMTRGPEPDQTPRRLERDGHGAEDRGEQRWTVSAGQRGAQRDNAASRRPGNLEPGFPSPATAGKRDDEPHGREWMRQSTESGGDQAAKVARNGAGGTARVWKPATRRGVGGPEQSGTSRQLQRYHRRSGRASPGDGSPGSSASEGRRTPGERMTERTRRSRVGYRVVIGAADEVLEGECQAMSGGSHGRETGRTGRCREDAGDQGESSKVMGGAGKPRQPATGGGPGSNPHGR